jgi:beta-glucanase (GH16 family)
MEVIKFSWRNFISLNSNSMQKNIILLVLVFASLFSACKKKSGTDNVDIAPTNLTLTANVTTDNSGNVAFVAAATNAVNYEFDFGNGIYQNVANGIITHKYLQSGTFIVNVIAKSASNKTVSKSISVTVAVQYNLVFSDEFNTAGAPDPTKWGYDLGAGGWGNNELQYYTNRADNSYIDNGTLKISLKREAFSGSAFTSARLLSKNKFSFKYGKVECSAKLPSGGGTWPAIWMLGDNINAVNWPACGEIDIMEHVGNQLNRIYATMHYTGNSGGNGVGSSTLISNATIAFHKYGMEWNASFIKFYVDDVLFYTFTNTSALPFNQNFFLILNVAMGGNFGGAVDPAFNNSAMEIDYIRVYQ